ncbi:MAG TPA: nickel pincer cofactor biosynthesis protein LarB [Rhizomicrobium sp.]
MTTNYDYDRAERLGMPEAVLCESKDRESLDRLLDELHAKAGTPVLFTRLTRPQFELIRPDLAALLDYDEVSGTAYLHGVRHGRPGRVAVVCAGTSDLPVAREAVRTLTFMGIAQTLFCDVGVAGLHRLLDRIDEIRRHDIVIAVAGMDAALASVVGGLAGCPVIGVPTSVGYGVAADGRTALNAMLTSCAQGVLVTNIDNGFGAACGAVRMLNVLSNRSK